MLAFKKKTCLPIDNEGKKTGHVQVKWIWRSVQIGLLEFKILNQRMRQMHANAWWAWCIQFYTQDHIWQVNLMPNAVTMLNGHACLIPVSTGQQTQSKAMTGWLAIWVVDSHSLTGHNLMPIVSNHQDAIFLRRCATRNWHWQDRNRNSQRHLTCGLLKGFSSQRSIIRT
jgi:hypothetical protein